MYSSNVTSYNSIFSWSHLQIHLYLYLVCSQLQKTFLQRLESEVKEFLLLRLLSYTSKAVCVTSSKHRQAQIASGRFPIVWRALPTKVSPATSTPPTVAH